MGIPSFFSYIVKNYSKIIYPIQKSFITQYFYLDCNSIIYTEYYKLNADNILSSDIETILLERVCETIQEYINIINPQTLVYISFDGVAPAAKLHQQKIRRYKSDFEKRLFSSNASDSSNAPTVGDGWNTSSITPGTEFMRKLHYKINSYSFSTLANIEISSSFNIGEGEHKIFNHIRRKQSIIKQNNIIIYGLDADLIILALNHLVNCKNIYLFRETPHFIKNIDSSLNPDKLYLCDIPLLGNIISQSLYQKTVDYKSHIFMPLDLKYAKIRDYVFLSFFLGNDFLPHFPSANIRTNGIGIIINAYFSTVKNTETLIKTTDGNPQIQWSLLREMLKYLSENEHENLCKEYDIRDRQTRSTLRRLKNETNEAQDKVKQNILSNMPIIDRKDESYIDPFSLGWNSRYYSNLFNIFNTESIFISNSCTNYFEGLEWTMKYYTCGCPHWRWHYKYNYPPLFIDLFQYSPCLNTEFITDDSYNKPIHPYIQLCYVLPHSSLYLLPKHIQSQLDNKWYDNNCSFKWAFCKYFWEAHIDLPNVTISQIEKKIKI